VFRHSSDATPSIVINALAAAGVVAFSGTAKATTFDMMSAGRCSGACTAGAEAGTDSSGAFAQADVSEHLSFPEGEFSPFVDGFPTFVASDFAMTDRSAIASIILGFGMGSDAFLPGAPSLASEPGTLVLFGCGLLGLSFATFRQSGRRSS